MSSAPAPVSSPSRKAKVVPARLTRSLTTREAMISRRSGWRWSCVAELLAEARREVALELAREVRVLRQVGGEQLLAERDLRVREQGRELRRGQPATRRLALVEPLVGRQELELAVQRAVLLEAPDVALVHLDHRRRLRRRARDGLGLLVVVAQDERRDLVAHLGEDRVPLLPGQVAVGDDRVEQDLDVDLVVGAVDAGRVVDRVHVDPAAAARVGDPCALREAEVPALADDAAAQLLGVDPDGVVRAVADLGVPLLLRLHVGADAAVPEQVDRSVEQGVDELARSQRLGLDAERRPRFGRERDRLRRPREDAAAGRDQRRVVVRPGRARQLEEPLALGEARRRIRIRVEEDVPVVERADQLDVTGEQHAVAEHVAGHVANPDNSEVGGLDVGPQLAEVALDRLPGAARRDRHLLVVVAGGAAGGERVAEPEAVLDRDCVRDVREGRRALVGGDDEVRVVLVMANDVRRRHDLAPRRSCRSRRAGRA